jgi:nicotinate-nucleotide adenylyltransferase
MTRIGVYGGTFDPIHVGHLAAAEAVRDAIGLDRIVFVPNWQQPLKQASPSAGPQARLEMVRRAIAGNPAFLISEVELRHRGASYTIDTLDALRREYGGTELCFILGVDALNQLARWREPGRILREYAPIAMLRAGWPGPDWPAIEAIDESARRLVRLVQVPALDIASSELRSRVAAGRSIRYLVPDAVREMIERDGTYRLDSRSVPE